MSANSNLTDLIAELMRNPTALDRAVAEAEETYNRTRNLQFAPVELIDFQWGVVKRKFVDAASKARGQNQNSEIDWLSRAERLSVAREAIVEFAQYFTLSREELDKLRRQSRDDAERARHSNIMATAAAVAPNFNAAVAVSQLAQKGVTLRISEDGTLRANPAALLTDDDFAVLRSRREALVAYLCSSEVVV